MDESLSVQMVREKIGILWKKQCHFWRQNGEYNEKIFWLLMTLHS